MQLAAVLRGVVLSTLVVSCIGKALNPKVANYHLDIGRLNRSLISLLISGVEFLVVLVGLFANRAAAATILCALGAIFFWAHRSGRVGEDCGCFGVTKANALQRVVVTSTPFMLALGSPLWLFPRSPKLDIPLLFACSVTLAIALSSVSVWEPNKGIRSSH